MQNGGIVGFRNIPSAAKASGMWSLQDSYTAVSSGSWPSEINRTGLGLWLDARIPASYPGTGTTWFDISGNGLNATGSSALVGGSLSDRHPYTTATTSLLNTDTHSIFFMIQINGVNASFSKLFGYEAGGSDRSPGIWRHPSTRRLHWRYDPSNTSSDFSLNSIADNAGLEFYPYVWYYLGVVKNGATATRYVNGRAVGSSSVSATKTAGTAQIKLYPGYNDGSSRMGAVHIYNRSLSAAEVLSNFNATRGLYGI